MPSRWMPVLALLAVALSAAAGQTTVAEPSTGIDFPVSLVPPGGTTPHHLMGTAVRTRTIFRVRVYAVGLYVDPEPARQALSSFAGAARERLERDAAFGRALLELRFPMTLRLVMARDVAGEDIATSFDDALGPRIRAAAARSMPGGDAALAEFRAFFDLEQVARGTEIVFSCSPDGRLETTVSGADRPRIASRALCRALFDVYLGERPLSGDIRRHLLAGFAGLLG